jgi:hypothetical protein
MSAPRTLLPVVAVLVGRTLTWVLSPVSGADGFEPEGRPKKPHDVDLSGKSADIIELVIVATELRAGRRTNALELLENARVMLVLLLNRSATNASSGDMKSVHHAFATLAAYCREYPCVVFPLVPESENLYMQNRLEVARKVRRFSLQRRAGTHSRRSCPGIIVHEW